MPPVLEFSLTQIWRGEWREKGSKLSCKAVHGYRLDGMSSGNHIRDRVGRSTTRWEEGRMAGSQGDKRIWRREIIRGQADEDSL